MISAWRWAFKCYINTLRCPYMSHTNHIARNSSKYRETACMPVWLTTISERFYTHTSKTLRILCSNCKFTWTGFWLWIVIFLLRNSFKLTHATHRNAYTVHTTHLAHIDWIQFKSVFNVMPAVFVYTFAFFFFLILLSGVTSILNRAIDVEKIVCRTNCQRVNQFVQMCVRPNWILYRWIVSILLVYMQLTRSNQLTQITFVRNDVLLNILWWISRQKPHISTFFAFWRTIGSTRYHIDQIDWVFGVIWHFSD